MRVRILGKLWNLRFVRSTADYRGECDPCEQKSKEIRILSSLAGEEKLEVLIHEMLHAADWHRSEEWVETVSKDIARTLTKLGYKEETLG